MTEKHDQNASNWVRCSDYAFVEGPHGGGTIAPSPGATLVEYSPRAEYRAATRGYAKQPHDRGDTKGEPAYLALWRLGQQFAGWFDREPPELNGGEQAAILEFVRANGLLGIFHHSVLQVGRSHRGRVWARGGGHWYVNTLAKYSDSPLCLQMPLVDVPHVDAVPFADIAKEFFGPQMPRTLPSPMSQDFFKHYRESAELFLLAAHDFWRAVEDLQHGEPAALDLLRGDIGRRLKPVHGAQEKGQPPFEEEPVYPSLLGALADMAARDLALGGFRLTACTECGDLLRTNFHRTVYCSEQCRWKAVQRTHRQKAERAAKRVRRRTK